MVSFSLRQTTSVQDQVDDAPLYRVVNEITAAEDANAAVFVYKTTTQAFVHYATAADMEAWPVGHTAALSAGAAFYRHASVQRDWATLTDMYEDIDTTKQRVQALANELTALRSTVVTDVTTVIEGV